MRYIQFNLTFHHSMAIKTIEDMVPAAEYFAAQGFCPARRQESEGPLIPVIDFRQEVIGHYHRVTDTMEDTMCLMVVEGFPRLTASYRYAVFLRKRGNVDQFQIGGLTDFEFRDERSYVEPLAQKLKNLGFGLYPLMRPVVGWVDEVWCNHQNDVDETRRRLRGLGWLTFFGPEYVARLGREFLLGIPGYQTGELDDGGIFHQLTPNFVQQDRKEARALRKAVVDYFAQAGHKITCKAPYAIPGLSPQSQEPETIVEEGMTEEEELQAYLNQLWQTTLVLKDGTRVKTLYLEWGGLSPNERSLALTFLQWAIKTELAEHAGATLHCEFNEIPPDLRRVLEHLTSENPQLSYQQVKM